MEDHLMHNMTTNMTHDGSHNDSVWGWGQDDDHDHSAHGGHGEFLVESSTSSEPFCTSHSGHGLGFTSGGMIMYMDGFRFTLKGNQPCLNLYFPGWTLDTAGKFAAAMIGVFLLAVCVEGISKWRRHVVRAAKRGASPSAGSCNPGGWNPHVLRWTITALHGFQAFTGYILMLATMTFSVELLLSVVVGLAAGYAVFFQTEADYLEETVHVSTNPCCNFMEEEAREVKTESQQGPKVENEEATTAVDAPTEHGTEDLQNSSEDILQNPV